MEVLFSFPSSFYGLKLGLLEVLLMVDISIILNYQTYKDKAILNEKDQKNYRLIKGHDLREGGLFRSSPHLRRLREDEVDEHKRQVRI
ncbi:uncharacterized protein BDR25DRAFT_124012 [Lindgomyces ingoldianus]|uniref:Uncharacterized protein n=1 Tax=Lindgomyces ingoldianus TaxID=673940 RepID=A0ACB6R2N4_9PLEO|nr:uncharacterized protein BDR25DRAFT_124012 [Lindgomyces ingoldianus]KAF2473584.1 hypothetical protein BDR25DRAFT_124012 [Lindgomyces ingoldianus]